MKELRIVLGEPAFRALVRGGEVEVRMEDGQVVKMILQDIGWHVMEDAIEEAQMGASALYAGVVVNPNGDEIKPK